MIFEVTLIDLLTMLTVFVTILLLMVCCTCYMNVARDRNDLFYRPRNINFKRRRRSLSPVGYKVFIVEIPPEVHHKKIQDELKYLEYPVV